MDKFSDSSSEEIKTEEDADTVNEIGEGTESTDDEDGLQIILGPEQFALAEANTCALLFYYLLFDGDLPETDSTNNSQCWKNVAKMAKKLRKRSEQPSYFGGYLATTDILTACINGVNKGNF